MDPLFWRSLRIWSGKSAMCTSVQMCVCMCVCVCEWTWAISFLPQCLLTKPSRTLSHPAQSTVSVSFISFSLSPSHSLPLLSLTPPSPFSFSPPISLSVQGIQGPRGPPGEIGRDGPKVCALNVIISYYANGLLLPSRSAILSLF